MKKLFTTLFGSKLYGTSTPTSDRDVKHVVLPDLRSLLLGKSPKNVVKKTNNVKDTRNTADDVDEEFIPIQILARDFMMGQTYALELAFAVDGVHAEQTFYAHPSNREADPFYLFTRELREQFLTSNIKAMMGYAVNQATLYSFKGERLNAVTAILKLLGELLEDDRTREIYAQKTLDEMFTGHLNFNLGAKEIASLFPRYFKITEYDIGDGRMKPCFSLLEKTLSFTNTVKHTLGVVEGQRQKYGSRAADASETNVDWKATMHALRIVDEGISLLTHRHLGFPVDPSYAQKLLSIKRGELPIELVRNLLDFKLENLKHLEQETLLPAFSPEMNVKFESWLEGWMRTFYNIPLT